MTVLPAQVDPEPPVLDPPVPRRRALEQAIVGAIALATALSTALAQPHPTASRPADVVLALAFGAGVVALSAVGRPIVWVSMSAIAAAATTGPWVLISGVTAALIALAARRGAAPCPVVGALVGAVVVQALLRMPDHRFAVNLLVGALVVGGLVVTSWPALAGRTRRRLRWVAIGAGAAGAVAVLGLVLALVLSRQDLQRGVASSDDGLDEVRAGRGTEAADLLEDAGRSFTSAHADLDAWWAKPALLIPGLGQNAQAMEVLAAEGAALADAAATAARSARVEDIRVTDGQMDLDHVRSMATPLTAVRSALGEAERGTARAASPWLVAPLADRLGGFQRSIESATDDATTASAAVAVLPDLLGGGGPRRYFVMFGTPSEARELGGFMGAYAILQAEDGKVSLRSTGRVRNLNEYFVGGRLTDPTALPDHYRALLPQKFWQNLPGSPDFPTAAGALHQLWRPPGVPLDGVLYMDPEALATMLRLTGPITVDGLDTPLTADTAAEFLLRDQYIEFPDDDRHDFLVDAATSVFDLLTSSDLPPPGELADTMAPAVRQRRLLFHSFHADEQALFERLDVDGSLPPVQGDFLSVRSSNRGRSKIDAFMERTITYEVHADPATGAVRSTVTVEVVNRAPSTGLPYPVIGNHLDRPTGTSSTTVSVYTPLDLVDVLIEGAPTGRGASDAYDRNRYAALVDVPPGEARTVTFELAGTLDLTDGYHLDVVPQPLVEPDQLVFRIAAADGWVAGGRSSADVTLEEDEEMNVPFFSFGRA